MTTKSKLKPLPANIAAFRNSMGLNQSEFWSHYAVTQSGGSRFEAGRRIPRPLQMLIRLHVSGVITDDHLKEAKAK